VRIKSDGDQGDEGIISIHSPDEKTEGCELRRRPVRRRLHLAVPIRGEH
jgi:hypothetical protein